MPLQNRVTPDGAIIAHAARGTLMGNRDGVLHRADKSLGPRRWISQRWICCRLEFDGRQRDVMAPRRYTELFFLDEATALAAGHRPCFECRREDALAFAHLWSGGNRRAAADEIDRILHTERGAVSGRPQGWRMPVEQLPDGAMVRPSPTAPPHLVLDGHLHRWSPAGYSTGQPIALWRARKTVHGQIETLTPPSIIRVMKSGYRPMLHGSARVLG